jgi:hypothetical protein
MMSFLLLLCLLVLLIFLMGGGMSRKAAIYEFPFLAGATFFSFIFPQLIGLRHDHDLPRFALEKTIIMVFLCAAMCRMGYSIRNQPLRSFRWPFDDGKLVVASGVLTLIGAWFFFQISRMPEDVKGATMWSGTIIAYHFFAAILPYGFALAVLLYFKRPSLASLSISLFGSLFYLDRIFISGKRGVTLEFLFILVLGWWFGRRKVLPKGLVLASILLGTLALYSTGDYRTRVKEENGPKWQSVTEIPFLDNLKTLMTKGGEEMRNVVYVIEATERTSSYDYGLFHWNTLVFNYVPAQLVGEDFKKSLCFDLPNVAEDVFGYEASLGSTITGVMDCFSSFWYLGCLKFFFIAVIMRKIYQAACEGHFVAQLFYMLILTPALHTITHHTQWFISPWVHMILFLIPALYLARGVTGSRSLAEPSGFHAPTAELPGTFSHQSVQQIKNITPLAPENI